MKPNEQSKVGNRIVLCPTCGENSIYGPDNPARPFCSARCKNMDFGAWASENFRVQESPSVNDQESAPFKLQ
jgi:endogenous inhibitor of DNA gyrase (YacG/DUF329 family)